MYNEKPDAFASGFYCLNDEILSCLTLGEAVIDCADLGNNVLCAVVAAVLRELAGFAALAIAAQQIALEGMTAVIQQRKKLIGILFVVELPQDNADLFFAAAGCFQIQIANNTGEIIHLILAKGAALAKIL